MESLTPLQSYLDTIGQAVLEQDWPTYRAGVCLPFHLVNVNASLCITDESELRAGFVSFCQTLQAQRVTDFIRLAASSVHLDENLLSGRYVTHLLAGSHRLIAPFRSQITLRRQPGGAWQAASISHALANARWPWLLPALPPQTLTPVSPDKEPQR